MAISVACGFPESCRSSAPGSSTMRERVQLHRRAACEVVSRPLGEVGVLRRSRLDEVHPAAVHRARERLRRACIGTPSIASNRARARGSRTSAARPGHAPRRDCPPQAMHEHETRGLCVNAASGEPDRWNAENEIGPGRPNGFSNVPRSSAARHTRAGSRIRRGPSVKTPGRGPSP